MALNANSTHDVYKPGIKVDGELNDFQIIEENTECDDDNVTINGGSGALEVVTNLPTSLVKASSPVCSGSVAVTNSENVIIGNTTYFNGPVTIQQVIQNASGVENKSFVKTEDEDTPTRNHKEDSKNNATIKRFHIQKWHKITFCAVCIVILGGVFAILTIILSNNSQDNSLVNGNDEESTKSDNALLIAPDHLRIVPRSDWLAQPVDNKLLDKIRQPVPWVIISHTATEDCNAQSVCILRVRLIQMFHIESRGWDDIGYNFLVAGDGSAYYGRGWDYIGAHTLGYNKYSIGISFVGTFNTETPPQKQIDACLKLLKRGVALGKLAKDYKLFAHRQLASTLSPGDKLYDIIKEWPHFVKNFTDVSELIPNY